MIWLDRYTGKPDIICAFRCFLFIWRGSSQQTLPVSCQEGFGLGADFLVSQRRRAGGPACLDLLNAPRFSVQYCVLHPETTFRENPWVFCQREGIVGEDLWIWLLLRQTSDKPPYFSKPVFIPQFQKWLLLPILGALRHSFHAINQIGSLFSPLPASNSAFLALLSPFTSHFSSFQNLVAAVSSPMLPVLMGLCLFENLFTVILVRFQEAMKIDV